MGFIEDDDTVGHIVQLTKFSPLVRIHRFKKLNGRRHDTDVYKRQPLRGATGLSPTRPKR